MPIRGDGGGDDRLPKRTALSPHPLSMDEIDASPTEPPFRNKLTGEQVQLSTKEMFDPTALPKMVEYNENNSQKLDGRPIAESYKVIGPTDMSTKASAALHQLMQSTFFESDGVRWTAKDGKLGNLLEVYSAYEWKPVAMGFSDYDGVIGEGKQTVEQTRKLQRDNTLRVKKMGYKRLVRKRNTLESKGLTIENLVLLSHPGAAFVIACVYLLEDMANGRDDIDFHFVNSMSGLAAFAWHIDDHAEADQKQFIDRSRARQLSRGPTSMIIAGVGEIHYPGQGGYIDFPGWAIHRTGKRGDANAGVMWKLVGFAERPKKSIASASRAANAVTTDHPCGDTSNDNVPSMEGVQELDIQPPAVSPTAPLLRSSSDLFGPGRCFSHQDPHVKAHARGQTTLCSESEQRYAALVAAAKRPDAIALLRRGLQAAAERPDKHAVLSAIVASVNTSSHSSEFKSAFLSEVEAVLNKCTKAMSYAQRSYEASANGSEPMAARADTVVHAYEMLDDDVSMANVPPAQGMEIVHEPVHTSHKELPSSYHGVTLSLSPASYARLPSPLQGTQSDDAKREWLQEFSKSDGREWQLHEYRKAYKTAHRMASKRAKVAALASAQADRDRHICQEPEMPPRFGSSSFPLLTGTSSDVNELGYLDDGFGDIDYRSAMACLDTHFPQDDVSPDPLADDVPAPSSDHGNNLRHIFAEIAHSLSLRT